jgi:hypothetical protein
MTNNKTITASLEGARILVDENICQLQEYNFAKDHWYLKDEAAWPLARARAEQWLTGWNHMDRFAAMSTLTAPTHDF